MVHLNRVITLMPKNVFVVCELIREAAATMGSAIIDEAIVAAGSTYLANLEANPAITKSST